MALSAKSRELVPRSLNYKLTFQQLLAALDQLEVPRLASYGTVGHTITCTNHVDSGIIANLPGMIEDPG